MEIILRVLQVLMKIVFQIVKPLFQIFWPRQYDARRIPPIKHKILTLTLHQVLEGLQRKEFTSQELVSSYISRIKEVNPFLNAVVQDRFKEALKEAISVDKIILSNDNETLVHLFEKRPLFGVPFTVKEACGVKGMKQIVGSLNRATEKCAVEGHTVYLLREAGAIPLLTSANPEFCFSIETVSHTHGKCLNPYDSELTAGGSSGGEGALNGAGASIFGIGSDIAGSIRLPSMFNGVFGHKPTGGITSIRGHFPASNDTNCQKMLQLGPMSRFASDLPLILNIISGKKARLLNLHEKVDVKRIKIFYSFGFTGLNALLRQSVDAEIEDVINKAVNYFEEMGLKSELIDFKEFRNSFEISLSAIARLENFPYILNSRSRTKLLDVLIAFLRSLVFKTRYTKEALLFELSRRANAFMSKRKLKIYEEKAKILKKEIIDTLGDNGVLFFPTFTTSAFPHSTSLATIWNIDYTLLFNVLDLPATHIPMGLNNHGTPIGFQVVATPFNDRLCLQIAKELEIGFGGWVPPSENAF